MQRSALSALVGLILACATSDAMANMGIPMLVLAWPAYWLALIPVIVIEAFVGVRSIHLGWGEALRVTTIGNLWSTFLGIPIVWIALLLIEMAVGGVVSAVGADENWFYLLFPFMAAWIGPTDNPWIVYLAFILLAVPFCVASIWIERRVAIRHFPQRPAESIGRWVRNANIWSYIFLTSCAIAYPLFVGRSNAA